MGVPKAHLVCHSLGLALPCSGVALGLLTSARQTLRHGQVGQQIRLVCSQSGQQISTQHDGIQTEETKPGLMIGCNVVLLQCLTATWLLDAASNCVVVKHSPSYAVIAVPAALAIARWNFFQSLGHTHTHAHTHTLGLPIPSLP
eukprot:1143070-Pelagomonas_calceolata.AAC.4